MVLKRLLFVKRRAEDYAMRGKIREGSEAMREMGLKIFVRSFVCT